MRSGLVFNIQKYSVHDGPGIRTTVFLKGCPLQCVWCHNPEGMSREREIIVMESRCIRCGECRLVCPEEGAAEGQGPMPAEARVAAWSDACVEACPTGARQSIGQEMTVAQVLEAVLQDRVFHEDSGGGVTFSGGEPFSQPAFLIELLEACRSEGVHTAVDTCGMARLEDLLAAAANTDLFLYDLKLMDDERHRRYTGVSNAVILSNLRALGKAHGRIWLRVPIIPGINDDDAALEAAARFAASTPGILQVNLLPYHRTGLPKLRRLADKSHAAAHPERRPARELRAVRLSVPSPVGLNQPPSPERRPPVGLQHPSTSAAQNESRSMHSNANFSSNPYSLSRADIELKTGMPAPSGLPGAPSAGGMAGVEPPSNQTMNRALKIFADKGLVVKLGG